MIKMKKIIFLIFFTMTLFSCQDTRSRKTQNKEQYPPQKLFEGEQLEAAQSIFNQDNKRLENILENNSQIINQLSNEKGYTLLMYASIIENIDAMKLLLDKGADPNLVVPNEGLGLPLSHAVGTNNYEMAKLLFQYKANPNPAVGRSPLCVAMLLGNKKTERKMIDFLLENGADINHTSYLGDNIMQEAASSDLETAFYFLEKGGSPKIKGTELSPMAEYIQYQEKRSTSAKNAKNAVYFEKLSEMKNLLQDKYGIKFPIVKDTLAEARLRIQLYENLNDKDKKSVNFNKNYGENRYIEDKNMLMK